MPLFGIKHDTSIGGEKYVYYKRLLQDGYSGLYEKANRVLDSRLEQGSNLKLIAEYFKQMRDSEYEKEVKLLQTHFSSSLASKYDEKDPKIGVKLIHAINEIYVDKDLFNYHLLLIQETEGQKGIMAYFPYYLEQAWKKVCADNTFRYATLKGIIEGKDSLEKKQEDLAVALKTAIRESVLQALTDMFENANKQSGVKGRIEAVEKPYKMLWEKINKSRKVRNVFIDELISIYGLENFVDELGKEIKNTQNAKDLLFTKAEHSPITIKDQKNTKVGLVKEVESLIEGFASALDSAARPRTARPKIDLVMGANLDVRGVAAAFDSLPITASRPMYVRKAKAISRALANLNPDQFLIYVSSKDYTLNKDFERGRGGLGGFSADTKIPLSSWQEMISITSKRAPELVFSTLQTLKGAIGESEQNREQVNTMWARAIAGALFDDFDVSGVVPKTGGQTIHLLYLNGIYIPLSFYYGKLYEAFSQADKENERSGVVGVKINRNPETIKFQYVYMEEGGTPENNEELWRMENPGESPWALQSTLALDNIKITFHFLAAFKKIMQEVDLME